MTPTLAVGFKANPASIVVGGEVRFFPYVYDSTGTDLQWPYPIVSWYWQIGGALNFTTDLSGTNLLITNASTYYSVNDQVTLVGNLPTGLSSTPVYFVISASSSAITISLTLGGSAVSYTPGTGSGSWAAYQSSSYPNPVFPCRGFNPGTYYVSLKITDSQGNTANAPYNPILTIDSASNVPVPPNDGTYQAISVLLYNATESALVTRVPPTNTTLGFSNFYLMYPDVVNNLDKMGTATFSLLDVGTSTATDQSLNNTGTFVMIFAGQNLIFSGKIQTSNQSTQNGFSSSNAVILWNVTCESDYGKLLALNVPQAALDPNGYALIDAPGDIARRILQPVAGLFGDWRGQICCEDVQISYQLNNANNLQNAGDIYDKMETLRVQSTYDLRTRMDYLLFEYSTYAANVVTISGASFTTSEFVGCWAIFPVSTMTGEVKAYGQITANTGTTITIATLYGSANVPASNNYIIIARWPVVDFAPDLTQPTPIQAFNVNANTGLSVFGYTDNYNQKKVVTKAVAKGTDVDGVSISVGISAIHAYNVATQFFENSTYITVPSEGYVYQNTYSTIAPTAATISPAISAPTFTTNYTLNQFALYTSNPITAGFQVGMSIQVLTTGTLPGGLIAGTDYYIWSVTSTYIMLSTLGPGYGSNPNVIITSNGAPNNFLIFNGQVSGPGASMTFGTPVIFYGTSAPRGITFGTTYYWGSNNAQAGSVFGFICTSSSCSAASRVGIGPSAGSGVYIVRSTHDVVNLYNGAGAVWLYGWNLAIPSGTILSLVTTGGSPISVTTTGLPTNVTMNDGTQCSLVPLSATILSTLNSFANRGYCLSPYIFVQSTSAVYTSGSVTLKVGEESLTVTAAGTNATWGPYLTCTVAARLPSTTVIAYPHGIGAMVAMTDYTESSPQTGSPVQKNGLLIQTLTAGSTITYGNLDTYATLTLLGKSTFYPKASCWTVFNQGYVPQVGAYYAGVQQVSLSKPPQVGDRIYVQKNTNGPLFEWQVVAVEWNFDQGQIILTLGDFEKNVFNLLQNETQGFNWTIT